MFTRIHRDEEGAATAEYAIATMASVVAIRRMSSR